MAEIKRVKKECCQNMGRFYTPLLRLCARLFSYTSEVNQPSVSVFVCEGTEGGHNHINTCSCSKLEFKAENNGRQHHLWRIMSV